MKESKNIIIFRNQVHFYYSYLGKILRVNLNIDEKEINTKENQLTIENIINKFEKIVIEYKKENELQKPPIEHIKLHLFNPDKIVNKKSLISLYDNFLESIQKNKRVKEQSKLPYYHLKNNIENYLKLCITENSDTSVINQSLLDNFINYITDPAQNLAIATLKKRLTYFYKFCKFIGKNKLINFQPEFEKIKFDDHKKEVKQVITLTKQELKYTLDQFEKEKNPKYRKTLSMFLFQCFTSLRYSDINQIHKNNPDLKIDVKNKRMKITIIKTGVELNLKLNDFLMRILEENNFELNHFSSQQYLFNIHEIFKNYSEFVPSLKEEITKKKKLSLGSIPITKLKYQFISSHSTRRTFISICIGLNINFIDIMNMTGHTDIKLLNEYLDIYNREKSGEKVNVSTEMLNYLKS